MYDKQFYWHRIITSNYYPNSLSFAALFKSINVRTPAMCFILDNIFILHLSRILLYCSFLHNWERGCVLGYVYLIWIISCIRPVTLSFFPGHVRKWFFISGVVFSWLPTVFFNTVFPIPVVYFLVIDHGTRFGFIQCRWRPEACLILLQGCGGKLLCYILNFLNYFFLTLKFWCI